MTDRKNTSPGFWITVALVAVLVAYPPSFGPACRIYGRKMRNLLPNIYLPIGLAMEQSDLIRDAAHAYGSFALRPHDSAMVPIGDGSCVAILSR